MSDIRSSADFFGRLGQDYKENKEKSFLFGYLKSEYMTLPDETGELMAALQKDKVLIGQHLLLSPGKKSRSSAVNEDERKQEHSRRSCFYKELYQNSEAARVGLIQPEDCLMWLLEYLVSHRLLCRNVMFEGSRIYSPRDYNCVEGLLRAGLDEDVLSELEDNKNELTHIRKLLSDEAKRAKLKEQLKSMNNTLAEIRDIFLDAAIHREAVTLLVDSGNARKKDKTLNMFFRYAGSGIGQSRSDGRYFYYIDEDDSRGETMQFMEVLNTKWESDTGYRMFIPLVTDILTGCVLFLAGKGNYEYVYENSSSEKTRKAYKDCDKKVCFDYLRAEGKNYMEIPGNMPEGFRLMPFFHINAGKSYQEILVEFKKYCNKFYEQVVQAGNETKPAGIPDIFAKFFWEDDEPDVSDEARENYNRAIIKNIR